MGWRPSRSTSHVVEGRAGELMLCLRIAGHPEATADPSLRSGTVWLCQDRVADACGGQLVGVLWRLGLLMRLRPPGQAGRSGVGEESAVIREPNLLPAANFAVFWCSLDNVTVVVEDEKPSDGKLQTCEQGANVLFGSKRHGLHPRVDEGLRVVRRFENLSQSLRHLLFSLGQEHLQEKNLAKCAKNTHPAVGAKSLEFLR